MVQQKQLTSWRPRGFYQWLLTILAVIAFLVIGYMTYYIWNPSGLPNIMSGPADMTEFYNNDPSPDYVQSVMETYIGGTPSQFPDRYTILSPISYIQENTPPTITLLGASDRIVPEEQAEILNGKLKENNIPHEFYLLPKADHIFDLVPDNLSTQFAYEKVKAFLQKYN
ncbi:hypothetical protein E0485_08480 [Paenibacillus albiflavus]|uniref:BD-FAE-like domain-containing protein n=2 Tax=Paenibacillus albiflavus TaxID=2545760 RepID=A0A4R4EE58_9BACL|nr:hypothetical protein E0485_08480 [Paenibacillus albiflavus]